MAVVSDPGASSINDPARRSRSFLTMALLGIMNAEPVSRAGRFPEGRYPRTASVSPTPSGSGSPPPSPSATTTAGPAIPGTTIARWSTASSGTFIPAPRGPTPPSAMAPGRRSRTASTAGAGTGPGPGSSTRYCSDWTEPAASTATRGASMPPSAAPTSRPPERKENPGPPPRLGGPAAARVVEPPDHAPGRSRGGFRTQTHLVSDGQGIVLAVLVTAGQRHESKGFEPVMARARRPRQAGRPRWPEWEAGDKGYSYQPVRRWPRRHRIEPVIPTRKDQRRDEGFEKGTYRRRNIIERAVGRFRWCRAPATRHDELAVNDTALWIIAARLSETT
jgi:transposase